MRLSDKLVEVLRERKAIAAGADALEVQASGLAAVRAVAGELVGVARPSLATELLTAIERKRDDLWREQVRQTNWELFDRGVEAFTWYALEETVRAAKAAALLDQLMCGKTPLARRILIPPLGIVVRQSTDVTATADPYVAKAVRFIREHAAEGIDVGDVLRHVMISRTALDKRFLKVLGHTPHEEIRRVRLKRARELLAEVALALAAPVSAASSN